MTRARAIHASDTLPAPAETGSSVRAVERALQLIEVFARSRGPLAITDLARTLDLAPSTVHRLVQTLTALGYVAQYPQSKRYGPGRGIAEITRAMLLKHEYTQYARPYLDDLVAATGETASLAALYGTCVLHLAEAESPNMVRVTSGVGTLQPLHCTAFGKIFLADLETDTRAGALDHTGLPALTPRTLTTRDALERELQRVRLDGYAVDDEECAAGARSVAVGLRGSSGAVVAAIGVSGPSSRVTRERIPELVRILEDAAARFAGQLRKP